MNMFKSSGATTVAEYMDQLTPERREIIDKLDELIRSTTPGLKTEFAYNMLGYSIQSYKNRKGEVTKWPVIGLANQKNYISLYVCTIESGKYLAEEHKDKLGKVSVGKSCVRFKKLEDLNLQEIEKLIQKSLEIGFGEFGQ